MAGSIYTMYAIWDLGDMWEVEDKRFYDDTCWRFLDGIYFLLRLECVGSLSIIFMIVGVYVVQGCKKKYMNDMCALLYPMSI
jgi:hypothetical protein